MNAKEAYGKWVEFDASRKGVLQEEAFAAGWQLAMERSRHIVKISYILDESEDIKRVILDNLGKTSLTITQAQDDAYYQNHFKDGQ